MMECYEFYQKIGGWLPYGANPTDESDHQVKMWERLLTVSSDGELSYPLTFLRGSVGSGKTESVLFPCLSTLENQRHKRLFLVYPTRSLVDDQIERILGKSGYLEQFANTTGQTVTANVDTGSLSQFWRVEHGKRTCYEDHRKRVWSDGKQTEESLDFPYNPLYNADIILTTLDKFIFRFFGYGKRRWSYIFPFRIKPDLRSVTICFDEAHIYDSVAFTNFRELVNALISHGVQITVMSATLPSSLIHQTFPYAEPLEDFVVDGFVKGGDRNIQWRKTKLDKPRFASEVKKLLIEAQPSEYKRIVVVNTVEQAYLVYSALQESTNNLFFYHGRQLTKNREITYRELRYRDKAKEPYTLVTTSAIEVGCDLSADLLITEMCNPDQLVQRIGRCARKSGQGRVFVLGDKVARWMRDDMIDEEEYLTKQLPDFAAYTKNSVDSLTSVIQGTPLMDVRIEMLFGALYDFVYEGDMSHLPLYKTGFVITRSWIPSVTLYFVDEEDLDKVGWHEWSNAPLLLSVNLEYLAAYKTSLKEPSEVEQAQINEDTAFIKSSKSKSTDKRRILAGPFRTNSLDPTEGYEFSHFCVWISLDKDRDYEENWMRWEDFRTDYASSSYEHELAIILRHSDFPEIDKEGLVEKLKLFKREYQSRRQRILISYKSKNGERRIWYLQGES